MNGSVLLFTRKARCERGERVLEVGSLDVNGSPRPNFENAGEYVGIDFLPGRGVDRVMNAEDLAEVFQAGYFDRVLACETLEHCEHWREVVRAFWTVLKPGGLACITTPTIKKGRHNYPSDYWRFTLDEYRAMFRAQEILRCEDIYARGIGVIVRKLSEELHLEEINPQCV